MTNNTRYWLCCGSTNLMQHRNCTEHLMGHTERRRFGTAEEHRVWLDRERKTTMITTDKEIMEIWSYINGKADGLKEAGKEANVPLMFAHYVNDVEELKRFKYPEDAI